MSPGTAEARGTDEQTFSNQGKKGEKKSTVGAGSRGEKT